MAEFANNRRNKRKKLKDLYRLTITEDDTLKEVYFSRFTIFNTIVWTVSIFLLLTTVLFLIISFTPVRYLVPGYSDINNNKVYVELSQKIENLENELTTQKIYTEGFKKLLNPSGIKLEGLNQNDPNISKIPNNDNFIDKSLGSISLENFYFSSPIKGEISSNFDISKSHFGLDIVAPENSPILSILDGVVINSDWSDKTGNTISVQHSGDLISIFKHNSVLLKKTGDFVKKGEAIAIIGNTGELTSGPHVHIELWNRGVAMNPQDYLSFN